MKPPKIVEKLCGSVCIRRWTSLSTFPSGSSPVRTVCFSDSRVGIKPAGRRETGQFMCLFACSCDQRSSGQGVAVTARRDGSTELSVSDGAMPSAAGSSVACSVASGEVGSVRAGSESPGGMVANGCSAGKGLPYVTSCRLLSRLELAVKARRRQMLVLTSQQKANAHAAPQVLPHPS